VKLLECLPAVLALENDQAEARLLDLLAYRKRGSFDDRTLVILALSDTDEIVSQENASHTE